MLPSKKTDIFPPICSGYALTPGRKKDKEKEEIIIVAEEKVLLSLDRTITQEHTPIPKSPEEIQEEIDFIAFTLGAGEEGNPNMNYICDPWPNHLPVTGLFVDSDGNLWARKGGTDIPTFDIWNEELELIGNATIPTISGDASTYKMVFGEDYIVAWDENPEDFQKIYFFEID